MFLSFIITLWCFILCTNLLNKSRINFSLLVSSFSRGGKPLQRQWQLPSLYSHSLHPLFHALNLMSLNPSCWSRLWCSSFVSSSSWQSFLYLGPFWIHWLHSLQPSRVLLLLYACMRLFLGSMHWLYNGLPLDQVCDEPWCSCQVHVRWVTPSIAMGLV